MQPVKSSTRGVRGAGLQAAWLCAILALFTGGCDSADRETSSPSQQVDALFAKFTEGVQPGAAVMVIRDGEIVHQAGYGYANLEERIPIDADTAFRLASVSKQFTAMAVMLLAQEGRLAYDNPVSLYLPQLAPFDAVTVRHLMTHTGGLPEYYDVIDTSAGMPANEDALALLSTMGGTVFVPGERYEYSNPGYDVLASLVAVVAGMDFTAFMREADFRAARNGRHAGARPHPPRSAVPGYRLPAGRGRERLRPRQ